jgi:hypothetical protein
MATHKVIWMLSAFVLSPAVATLHAAAMSGAQVPSVRELLDRYTATLDTTRSLIDFYEATTEYDNKTPSSPSRVGGKKLERGEHRTDGHRTYWRCYSWGDFNSQVRDLPESTPRYNLRIEVDKNLYAHATAVNDPRVKGTASWQPSKIDPSPFPHSPFSGIFGVLGATERLDVVLRGASRISARRTMETVDGSPCYVIDARARSGRYTVWLDPEHGCQPAKAIRKATGGNQEGEDVLPRGSSVTTSVSHIRFEQVDGVWVPMEAEQTRHAIYPGGQFFAKQTTHVKRTRIALNPDHDKLGSFADPRDNAGQDPELKNGTRITIFATGGNHAKGHWQDGKVIDEFGETIDLSVFGY